MHRVPYGLADSMKYVPTPHGRRAVSRFRQRPRASSGTTREVPLLKRPDSWTIFAAMLFVPTLAAAAKYTFTSSAPQVHLRHRVVRAFDGTHTITCAQRQQQLRRLLGMKDGVRRPATLKDRRGVPLDARAADSSPARGSAHASSRIGSRDPAAARHWSAAAGRCLWRPASSLEPAQVVDGRLYG